MFLVRQALEALLVDLVEDGIDVAGDKRGFFNGLGLFPFSRSAARLRFVLEDAHPESRALLAGRLFAGPMPATGDVEPAEEHATEVGHHRDSLFI